MKKIPMRMCIVTRDKYPKSDLIRIVKTKENEIRVDVTGKLNGKGAYLKKDIDVLKKAKQSKILNKTFELEVNDDVFLELEKLIGE